jgi:hypothetical protein
MKKLVLVALIVLQFSIYKVNEAKPIINVEKSKIESVSVLDNDNIDGKEVTNYINIESYNVVEYDKELNLERWMLDENLFVVENYFQFLECIEVEDRLILEDWMINGFVDLRLDVDVDIKIEDWMLDSDYWL